MIKFSFHPYKPNISFHEQVCFSEFSTPGIHSIFIKILEETKYDGYYTFKIRKNSFDLEPLIKEFKELFTIYSPEISTKTAYIYFQIKKPVELSNDGWIMICILLHAILRIPDEFSYSMRYTPNLTLENIVDFNNKYKYGHCFYLNNDEFNIKWLSKLLDIELINKVAPLLTEKIYRQTSLWKRLLH